MVQLNRVWCLGMCAAEVNWSGANVWKEILLLKSSANFLIGRLDVIG